MGLKLQILRTLESTDQGRGETQGQESATVNFSYICTHWLISLLPEPQRRQVDPQE